MWAGMSKGDILRGLVSERLAIATREILGAVDMLVAGYEEEASGFRREIERQKRELEVLLHEQQGCKHTNSLHPVDQDVSTEHAEKHIDLTPQTSSGRVPLSCQYKKKKCGQPRLRHVDIRVGILENSHTDVLTNTVQIQTLKCPTGLKEGDFVKLLKSSFPQLSGEDKGFDILFLDERQRLQPMLKELSLEGIDEDLSCIGWENSTLYIQIRDLRTCKEDANSSPGTSLSKSSMKEIVKTRLQMSCPVVVGSSSVLRQEQSQQERGAENIYVESHQISGPSESNENHRRVEQEKEREETTDKDYNSDKSEKLVSRRQQKALHCVKNAEKQSKSITEVCSGTNIVMSLADRLQTNQKPEYEEDTDAANHADTRRKVHQCGKCGKSLSDFRSLLRHRMTHSEERPHGCQVCGRRFKLAGTLRQHEKIHTDRERSYLCDICCKMFLTSKQLQIHLRTHSEEKPFHCSECSKGFATKGSLTIHMRIHTGETPYRCPDCGWSFKRKPNLLNHLRVHSGQKPFACGICGKACARKSYLTVHMRTHNGERPYKCSLCNKSFTQSHCLKSHMKSHKRAEAAGT